MTFTPADAFRVEMLPDGRVRTLDPFTWTGTHGDEVDVEPGTTSDGATRPRATAALVDQWGAASRGFLIHDELCERLRRYRAAPVGTLPRPDFDPVDTDGALRAILRELGTPAPLRWIYWTGVRWGALGSRYRWAGWWRTLPLLLALTPLVALIIVLPVVGAVLGRLLLALVELLVWPFTGTAPRRLLRRRARLTVAPAAALGGHLGTPTRPVGSCPAGTHSNTGTAADYEIAECPRCNPPRDHLAEIVSRGLRVADVLDEKARRDRGDVMHPGHRTWIESESIRGPRREARITRVGRAAARQLSRGVRATGRGIADLVCAVLDAW